MIDLLDETLRKMLVEEMGNITENQVSFQQPRRELLKDGPTPTLNLFLYDVRENTTLRQGMWDRTNGNGDAGRIAHFAAPPVRVDCFYMLTAWAQEPEDQHALLSRAMMVLFRYPIILPKFLEKGGLKNALPKDPISKELLYDVPARVAQPDRLTNPAEVWSALDNEIRPSIPYVVTLPVDPSWKFEAPDGKLVRTRSLHVKMVEGLPDDRQVLGEEEIYAISGRVLDNSPAHAPVKGALVSLKGTGRKTVETGEDGRFSFASLRPGNYTLVASRPGGQPVENEVNVNDQIGQDHDYDLEVA